MKNCITFIDRAIYFGILAGLLTACSSSPIEPGEETTGTVTDALRSPRTDVEIPTSSSDKQTVAAMALEGNMLFVAGNFQQITGSNGTKSRSDFALVNPYTDEIMPLQANTNSGGRLYAVAIAANLNLIAVGGCFTSINGSARSNLAVLNYSTGELLSWNPNYSTGCVKALAWSPDATLLYVGGAFTEKLSAVITSGGQKIDRFAPNPNGEVRALMGDSATGGVLAGGSFTSICGTSQHHLAAVDPIGRCGAAFGNSADEVLAIDNNYYDGTIYAATGGSANRVVAFNASNHALKWNGFQTMGDAQAVNFHDDKVYFGFHEGLRSATDGFRLARLNASDGSLDETWDKPQFPDNFFGVWSVIVDRWVHVMAVGGDFHKVNTSTRRHLALFNAD